MADEKKAADAGTPSLAWQRMHPAVELCRDVYEGTRRLIEKAGVYLPQFPKEKSTSYERRKSSSTLFNAYRRTVNGLAGMIYRKEPKISENVNKVVQEHFKDIDLAGRDLTTFGKDHTEDALIEGHAAIIVEMQRPDKEFANRLEEKAGLRPYWIHVTKDQNIRARSGRIGGRVLLTHFAYCENTVEEDGEFGEKEVERVRQYELRTILPEGKLEPVMGVVWRLFEKQVKEKQGGGTEEQWVEIGQPTPLWISERKGIPYPEIPAAITYANREGTCESRPPLEDLAYENVRHFRKQSDRDNAEHVGCIPILTLIGMEEDPQALEVGPTIALRFARPDGRAEYVEPAGNAYETSRLTLKDIEHHMAILGLSMLMSESRAAETATSKRIDKSESDSSLGSLARSHQAALNQANYFHHLWLSDTGEVDKNAIGTIEVNRDFENWKLDPQTLQALADLVPTKLSLETFWAILERGELLPEDFDPKKEKESIETAGMESVEAIAKLLRKPGGTGSTPPEDEEEEEEEVPAGAGAGA